ncbi:sulfotransferase family protein [Paraglaciecola sp.]|uniref:sulfotransferase family protein n=1 Tax=Paraglaciecola sp. TaxID=1920173 RepID=UPI0032673E3A
MSIINNTFNFIFIHVPKAAGTSVTNEFSKYTNYCDLEIGGTAFGEKIQPLYRNRFGLYKHIPAKELRAIMGQKDWSKFFKFSIVRHPADRLLSTFNFLREWSGTPVDLKERLGSFQSFDDFVQSEIWKNRPGPDNIFYGQSHWLCDKKGLLVDFVGKLESLDEDIRQIVDYGNLPKKTSSEMKKLNSSAGGKSYDSISIKSKKMINEFYQLDFELFGYEKLNEG